jgi:AraC family transcriptional regulator, positive regulator of tynA and feaB
MQTILTTAGMSPRDAFEYWHDVVSNKVAKHETKPFDRHTFYAEMKAGTLASVQIVESKMAPVSAYSRLNGDVLLLYLTNVSLLLQFPDREIVAESGNFVLNDTEYGSPQIHSFEPLHNITLSIPRVALAQRIPILKEHSGQPIPAKGDTLLLENVLRSLATIGPSKLSPTAAIRECEHVLDLIALMLGNFTGATPKLASPKRIAMVKLRIAIETRLTDPTADRASIAAAAGISERHANRLLAQEGTSITGLLRTRRLATCREAIERSNREINDIAREFGWTTNFARDFKQEFGLTPREARLLIKKNDHSGT